MEHEVFTPLLEEFLLSPLVCWVKTVSPLCSDGSHLSDFLSLVDGVYLNDIMLQINPKTSVQRTHKKVNNEPTLRIQNLSILIQHIRSYYQEVLQQLVVMSLPDVLVLGRTPLTEQGLEEMRKLLLLLLGCAVQCDRKEEYIDRIQTLDFDTQAAIAAHIQEVTHNQENVFDLQCVEESESDALVRHLTFNLQRLVDERDQHAEMLVCVTLERDSALVSPCRGDSPALSRTESVQHLSVELADAKARIRRLRQELEEKTEQLLDCRQELDVLEAEVKRLQQENQQLVCDARSLRAYRDELDALREKAFRVDKLESEVTRYKEKLHDIEFYRTRVEELKEDNQVLLETKSMLEDQLEALRARSDKHHELEKENLQLKNRIHDMEMERDLERRRMEELLEENLALELSQKQSMDESLHLGWELEQLSRTGPEISDVPQKSLGHEVSDLASSQLLKLEKENQSLLKAVEELRSAPSGDVQRLSRQLEQLQAELCVDRESLLRAEGLSSDLLKEKAQLEKTLETLKENADTQVKGLEQERDQLSRAVASLRQRAQVSAEARARDIETENRLLHESVRETSSKITALELELTQRRRDAERATELELELSVMEREREGLQKRTALTAQRLQELETENAELHAESRRTRKASDTLRNVSFQLELLQKDHSALEQENQELRRALESLRSRGERVAQLEQETRELQDERDQLRRGLETLRAAGRKSERLEESRRSLDAENQRLQKALESGARRTQALEQELRDAEAEGQAQQRALEELRISSVGMEALQRQHAALEMESAALEKDRKSLQKENARLRQQAELRDARMDEDGLRIAQLEKESRALGKELDALRDAGARVKELEMENRELLKQASVDRRTLATLREELVNEKLKTQQINNELEKLSHELEKIGLDKEGLLGDEESAEDRFRLLECKLESTLRSSLEIKAEKISALEARLQESSNLNLQLRQELKAVKKSCEALRQRQEEESSALGSPSRRDDSSSSRWERESQEATRELLRVKDRLIEVERNNATLQAEKQALRTQQKALEAQSAHLQAQIVALQRQTASLQESNTALQTQSARLQVENSTLSSRSAALLAQSAQLQAQASSAEAERDAGVRERDELIRDHQTLTALHERQAAEYEELMGRHAELKSTHRSLENRYSELLRQQAELDGREQELREEREQMLRASRTHAETEQQRRRLSLEHHTLSSAHQQLQKDSELLQAEHKSVKTQLNAARLEHTRLEAEFSSLREQNQQLDIASAKLTNQCELLSQLKGNLEEENRHLLDQIQTLMLQNRTLLEQTMESKDLFHVEQRQYIDKLNELRRQKEKLEEKIMDQYKFYDPSPPRRRGNWIALKMKKLIKPKSRERMRSLTHAPSRSESSEGFLTLPFPDSQDSSSAGSGSASLDDNQRSGKRVEKSHAQASSNALKKLPFMRNRTKDKDRVKAIYRRSMSMNDLLQSMAPPEGQWSSTDHLEAPEHTGLSQRDDFGSADYSTHTLPRSRSRADAGNTASTDDVTHTSEESSVQQVMNGSTSRPHSESSGDASLSLDSPARHTEQTHDTHTGRSAESEMMSLQQFLEESTHPPEEGPSAVRVCVSRERVKGRGILRSSSSRASGPSSRAAPSLRKAESTRVRGPGPRALCARSASELDSSSGLPRASSVISTAEGPARRSSIHDLLSRDSRTPVLVDPPHSPNVEAPELSGRRPSRGGAHSLS